MSISTANEVCITIIVNTSIAVLSPFIFFFLLLIILWMVYRFYWHRPLHEQLYTDEKVIPDAVLESKHMKWIFIRRVEPCRLQVSRLGRLFMYGSLSYN